MTNREKYAKEIAEITINGSRFAVKNGKICDCNKIKCYTCDLYREPFRCIKEEWANSEYKEQPTKTATEIVKETEEYRRFWYTNRAFAEQKLKELNNAKD